MSAPIILMICAFVALAGILGISPATERGAIEELVPLAQAAAMLPRRRAGKKTNVATLYRWTSVGCRGIKLRYTQVGGTRCTTAEWLNEFFDALTVVRATQPGGQSPAAAAPQGMPALRVRTSAERRRAQERAERILEAAGI